MHFSIRTLLPVAAICAIGLAGTAQAYVVNIDNFEVFRTGPGGVFTSYMNDPFDGVGPINQAEPYTIGGGQGFYGLFGSHAEGLVAGRRTLDTSTAFVLPSPVSASGFIRQSGATLLTNTQPLPPVVPPTQPNDCSSPPAGTSCGGLKSISQIKVVGTFDFVVPDVSSAGASFYEVRLNDRVSAANPGNDEVRVRVFRSPVDGSTSVTFSSRDASTNTSVTLGTDVLTGADLLHDQIMLMLQNSPGDHATFTGSYAFVDSGIVGPTIDLAGSATLFNGEDWTRAGFRVLESVYVPEPMTLAMFGAGLIGMGAMRRRRAW